MPYKNILAATVYFILMNCTPSVVAQSLIIDSLQRGLHNADPKAKPVMLAELARAGFEKNIDLSLKQAQQALSLAKQNDDNGARAFCYATMGHLLVQKGLKKRASSYIDSAVQYANKTNNHALAAFAWLRKGWFDFVEGNDEKAMSGFLKAEKLVEQAEDRRSVSYKVLVNHYVASIYAYGSDTLKHHKYAQNCYTAAQRSGYPDDIQLGYMTLAHSYFSAFERDTTKRKLLNTSLRYYSLAAANYQRNRDKILIQSNAAVTALNMANSYFKYFPLSYRDSAIKYINLALEVGRRTKSKEVIANCYGILSEYALRERNFKRAEEYLQTGIAELANSSSGVDITRSRLMLGLANVAEKSGDISRALAYYKQYTGYYAKVFDAQKLAITQQLEEDYQSTQKENEINRLRERAEYNNRLNWLYVAIGSAGIISLALLLSSYHFRLKASQKQKQLYEQEKEEANLLARLQQAEAQRLALEKQEAELQANLRNEESAKLQAQQELLQDRTEWLEKELLAGTLKIEEKNTILELLKEKTLVADSPAIARQIGRIINQNLRMDKNLDEQQQAFSNIHPGFFSSLQERADNSLTRLDLKYCAYILMHLDNKEVATRLGVEPKSIRMARYRLKQKLKLDKDVNLDQFIQSLEKPEQ